MRTVWMTMAAMALLLATALCWGLTRHLAPARRVEPLANPCKTSVQVATAQDPCPPGYWRHKTNLQTCVSGPAGCGGADRPVVCPTGRMVGATPGTAPGSQITKTMTCDAAGNWVMAGDMCVTCDDGTVPVPAASVVTDQSLAPAPLPVAAPLDPPLAPAAPPEVPAQPQAVPPPPPPPSSRAPKKTAAPPMVPSSSSASPLGAKLLPLDNTGALNLDGRVPPLVTKNGKRAFEVVYKKGEIHPKGTNANFMIAPKSFFPATQVRFSFKMYFDDDFPWTLGASSSQKKVGGKLIGFEVGEGSASGGNYSKTGASFRLTFAENGGVGPYLYPQVKDPKSRKDGDKVSEKDLDQNAAFWDIASLSGGGIHMFYPKNRKKGGKFELQMRKGQWNDVEMFIKLNTPGKFDGVVEASVNGAKVRFDQVRYRNDNALVRGVQLGTFFGGGNREYAPPRETRAWYADFAFSAA